MSENKLNVGGKLLDHVESLIWYDGPLLDLFKDEGGHLHIVYWLDSDNLSNTWLVAACSEEKLAAYKTAKIPLGDLLLPERTDDFLYKVTTGAEGQQTGWMVISPSDIPKDQLPAPDAFYVP